VGETVNLETLAIVLIIAQAVLGICVFAWTARVRNGRRRR
jgi:hypothetical protein